jgi:hypothetical protein
MTWMKSAAVVVVPRRRSIPRFMSSAAPDFRRQSRQPERNHNTSLTSPEWPLFAHCGRILPCWRAQASQQRAPKSVRQRESRSLTHGQSVLHVKFAQLHAKLVNSLPATVDFRSDSVRSPALGGGKR